MDKSHGEAPKVPAETSAQTHGLLRAKMGISIEQLVAEFRALRSSVLRPWGEAHAPQVGAIEVLGILGHDLRSPLQAISLTVEMMRMRATAPPAQTKLLATASSA